MRKLLVLLLATVSGCAVRTQTTDGAAVAAAPAARTRQPVSRPLVIGESLDVWSQALAETRTVHVFRPTLYGQQIEGPLPVIYLLDGGPGEDLLQVVGLVQLLSSNGGMRPAIVVGIQNTDRKRDLTGPTNSASDRKIAPRIGQSAQFRDFVRSELIPTIRNRYDTTQESALVGESLAGLFVIETLLLEPDLFDAYLAVDPSLWWADHQLVERAPGLLKSMHTPRPRRLFLACSEEPTIGALSTELARTLSHATVNTLRFHFRPMQHLQHGNIFHPALLVGLPTIFPPASATSPNSNP